MPLPIALPSSAADDYQRVTQMASQTLSMAQGMREAILRGGVAVEQLCELFDFLRLKKDDGERLAANAGLEDYAKTINGPDYSITQSFGAVLTAGTAITDWIIANVPNDGHDGVVTRRFVAGATTIRVVMDDATMTPLVALLDTLIGSIKG